jgi:hypothetical protein
MKKPQPGVGGDGGLGLPCVGTALNKLLTQRTIPPAICYNYDLRRSGKSDAGRAEYAALLHHRLHFI